MEHGTIENIRMSKQLQRILFVKILGNKHSRKITDHKTIKWDIAHKNDNWHIQDKIIDERDDFN